MQTTELNHSPITRTNIYKGETLNNLVISNVIVLLHFLLTININLIVIIIVGKPVLRTVVTVLFCFASVHFNPFIKHEQSPPVQRRLQSHDSKFNIASGAGGPFIHIIDKDRHYFHMKH